MKHTITNYILGDSYISEKSNQPSKQNKRHVFHLEIILRDQIIKHAKSYNETEMQIPNS